MKYLAITMAAAAGLAIGVVLPNDKTSTEIHHAAPVDDPHPLNDEWLGLTAVTSQGEKIGYVVDAPVNSQGRVDFVLISEFSGPEAGEDNFLVIDGQFAELRGQHLIVDRSAPGLARATVMAASKSG
jgi:hypothetical protein